jgi:hypothetical protein
MGQLRRLEGILEPSVKTHGHSVGFDRQRRQRELRRDFRGEIGQLRAGTANGKLEARALFGELLSVSPRR